MIGTQNSKMENVESRYLRLPILTLPACALASRKDRSLVPLWCPALGSCPLICCRSWTGVGQDSLFGQSQEGEENEGMIATCLQRMGEDDSNK